MKRTEAETKICLEIGLLGNINHAHLAVAIKQGCRH
jgi:hypothetical protein